MRTRLSAFLFVLPLSVFAGPFGLEMGMRVEQIHGAKPGPRPFVYKLETPPVPHSAFDYYILYISPETGLARIRAVGKDIATSGSGFELRLKFDEIVATLSAKYGKGASLNHLEYGSIWNEPRDWMMSILKKERNHVHAWSNPNEAAKADSIKALMIAVSALSNEKGYITVDYEFDNFSQFIAEQKRKEDEAL